MMGLESWFKARSERTGETFAAWLAPAILLALLAAAADVQADVAPPPSAENSPAGAPVPHSLIAVAQPPSVVANAADVSAGFNVKFREAIEAFRAKAVVTPGEFARLDAAAKARAFTVAGMTDKYALDQVKASLQSAIETGQMPNEWLTGLEEQFKSLGLSGVGDNAWHLKAVFRQNTYQAYGAGRWQQMKKVRQQRPFLQFVTIGDERVRPEHAALDGTIKRADDPWWSTHYPPLSFNCRCLVVSVSREEMENEGLSVTDDSEIADRYQQLVPGAGGMPPVDPRFAVNPDQAFGALEA